MNEVSQDEYKRYMIDSLSIKMLTFLAYYEHFESEFIFRPSEKKIKEWKQKLFNYSLNKLRKLIMPYYCAGSFTSFVHVIADCCAKNLKKIFTNKALFSSILGRLKRYYAKVITIEPASLYLSLFWPLTPEYKLATVMQEEQTKSSKPEFIEITEYEQVILVFKPEENIVEIRTSNESVAKSIRKVIQEVFSITLKELTLTKMEIEKLLDWAIITNSSIRFESGAISSSRFSSTTNPDGSRADLKTAPIFQEAIQKGNIVSVYIHLPGDYIFNDILLQEGNETSTRSFKESSEDGTIGDYVKLSVGFNVNFNKGKVFFASHIPEDKVRFIMKHIFEQAEINTKKPSCNMDHAQLSMVEFIGGN